MLTPMPGDFQLVPTGGPIGKAIELGQKLNGEGDCPYQHARLYVGNNRFVEAEPGGARISSHPLDGPGMWSTGIIPLVRPERDNLVTIGHNFLGVPYSALDYFALAAHRLHVPIPGLQGYIASTGHMICSQLVDQAYLDAGIHLFSDNRWAGDVTPASLWHLLLSLQAS